MIKNKDFFNNLKKEEQDEVCSYFLKLYQKSDLLKINEAFSKINPTVDWENGAPQIWGAHRVKFEELIKS